MCCVQHFRSTMKTVKTKKNKICCDEIKAQNERKGAKFFKRKIGEYLSLPENSHLIQKAIVTLAITGGICASHLVQIIN